MRLEGEKAKPWVWSWIAAMAREPALWPALFVGTCFLFGLFALVAVRALQSGNWLVMAGAGGLLITTLASGIRDASVGRMGVVSRVVLSLWGLAVLVGFISMLLR